LAFRLETNLRKRGIDGLTDASFRFFDLHSSGYIRKTIDDNAAKTQAAVQTKSAVNFFKKRVIKDLLKQIIRYVLKKIKCQTGQYYTGLPLLWNAATALYERLSIPPLTRYIIEDWK